MSWEAMEGRERGDGGGEQMMNGCGAGMRDARHKREHAVPLRG